MFFLIDSYPKDIKVVGSKICSSDLHDSVHCHLIYDNISAHIYVNWAHPFKEHKFVIMGTKGSLVYDDTEKKIYHYDKYFEINDSIEQHDGGVAEIEFESSMPLSDELDYFISNLHQKTFDKSSISHGVDVIKVLDKVEKEIKND
jgi:predicted dehydrogenase